jgi:monoamine oxidase
VSDYDVIVVGAGLAGLTAARELSGEGRRVLQLEARDRIGGRTWTRPDTLAGLPLEIGGQWLERGVQPRIYAEVARYGLPLVDATAPYALPTSWELGGRRVEGSVPAPAEQYEQLERAAVALAAAAARIDHTRPLSSQGLDDLDVTADEFFAGLGLDEVPRELAAYPPVHISSGNVREASILHPLRLITASQGLANYLGLGPTDFIESGTASLAAAIAEDSSAELRLQTPVQRIERDGDLVTVVAGELRSSTRALVMAVPLALVPRLDWAPGLPDAVVAAAAERRGPDDSYCEGGKVWAIVRNVPEDAVAGGNGLLRLMATAEVLPDGRNLMIGFTKSRDAIDVTDRAEIERALRVFFPNAEVDDHFGYEWIDDEFTGPAWPGYNPGWIGRYEELFLRPHGNVAFATSDVAFEWPGNMDGAFESGFRAAAMVRGFFA